MTVRLNNKYRGLSLVLIRPSKYDAEGYVIRHLRGVLPSNTLSCLYGLTQEVVRSKRLGKDLAARIYMMDETVTRVDPARTIRKCSKRGYKLLICLVGVQTNQFPRASDLARQFRALGADVMIGGFHVSGSIAMADKMPAECQELLDAGVTLVKGEVEDAWGDILADVIADRTQPFYDITTLPELFDKPIPQVSPKYMRHFSFQKFGTIDAGRGCPFNCSFCTIINVQGRKMRCRSADRITEQIRKNYRRGKGIDFYFFTDDNFARNQEWERIFDELIHLRQEEGIAISFMMQADMKATRIKSFVRKAALAGCSQVFLGLESLNDANLATVGKKQNKTADYAEIVEAWHDAGIAVHGTLIIGFPYDTYESIMRDVQQLRDEVLVDQASFFMLTPIPGSRDYADMVNSGRRLEPDFNRYDSFNPVVDHPQMSEEEWRRSFHDAWEQFYTPENMRQVLMRQNGHTYWGMFKNFVWYRNSMLEKSHPMITGFWRMKDRLLRRPGFAIDSRLTHYRKRLGEIWRMLKAQKALFFELQEIWLQTRYANEYAQLQTFKEYLGQTVGDLQESLQTRLEDLKEKGGAMSKRMQALQRNLANFDWKEFAARHCGGAGEKSQAVRGIRRINFLSVRRYVSRVQLDDYWRRTCDKLKRGRLLRINPFGVGLNAFRETKLAIHFFYNMNREVVRSS